MERMASAISDNRYRYLWKEKKIKGRNAVSANIVDDKSGEEGIAEVFSIKYNGLYNSVPYESEEVDKIRQEIDKKLKVEGIRNVININHVRESVSRLKYGKSGGEEGMCSDNNNNGLY